MNIPDIINGSYELLGAPFIFLSVINLYRVKKVRGVSWKHVLFFTTWGFWNLYYYSYLNQWCSFIGGIGAVIVNTIWLGQLLYYTRKEKKEI